MHIQMGTYPSMGRMCLCWIRKLPKTLETCCCSKCKGLHASITPAGVWQRDSTKPLVALLLFPLLPNIADAAAAAPAAPAAVSDVVTSRFQLPAAATHCQPQRFFTHLLLLTFGGEGIW